MTPERAQAAVCRTQVVGSVPILIAEVSTGLWLLIAGIRV